MKAYVLDKNIQAEKLLSDINHLIESHRKHSQKETLVLVITIKTISQENSSLIPKLEYKNIE